MAYDPSGFNKAYSLYDTAASNAMPSPESLDRSAARLRGRTDTEYNANAQRTADQYAGRGRSNSGSHDYAQTMNNYGRQQAQATGYADVLDDYEKQRMAGSANMANIANQYGDTYEQQQNLGLDQQKVGIAQHQADTGRYQAQTDRSTQISKSLTDFLTFMGTYGNTTGAGRFNQDFDSAKKGFLRSIGMGEEGWPEDPYFRIDY